MSAGLPTRLLPPLAALALAAAAPVLAASMAPAKYIAAAGAGDLYETQSSQLVLQSTADPKVRAFATMMVKDHGKSTAEVKAAAAKSHVKAAPPKLMPAQTEMIAQLKAESGPARDQAYIAQQKTAHNQALAIHQAYAADGPAAPLRAAAAGIGPVGKHHIELLTAM